MTQNNTPIDVICVCSAGGEMKPLRFQIKDSQHQMVRVNVDEVISVREIPYVGVEAKIYLCRGMVKGVQRLFELKYSIRTQCWRLFQEVL